MGKFIVFTDYGCEGWKPSYMGDSFEDAYKDREKQMGMGNSNVIIVKQVVLVVMEGAFTRNAEEPPVEMTMVNCEHGRDWAETCSGCGRFFSLTQKDSAT